MLCACFFCGWQGYIENKNDNYCPECNEFSLVVDIRQEEADDISNSIA